MNCQDIQKLLHGYVDGELNLTQTLEFEDHFQTCSACAQAHHALESLRATLRSQVCYYEPPADLQARVRSALRRASRQGSGFSSARLTWLAAAASIVLIGMVGWRLLHRPGTPTEAPTLAAQLLASHIRSEMLPDHLIDVKSSDQHTVKPWFDGKLDFSPPVVDLSAQGFVLVGGRLEYIDHRPVAAVVYRRHKHVINLFIWPSNQSSSVEPEALTRQGYHFLSWARSGMMYWAVSDLNETELTHFRDLVQAGPRPG